MGKEATYTVDVHEPQKYEISFFDKAFNASKKYPSNNLRTHKYTLLTFLPLNLYEQFKQFSNIYFFINACFSLIPVAAPVNPFTSISPLLIVLGVSAVKAAIEDYRRYQEDKKANSAVFERLRNGELETVISADIISGDIVYVKKGEQFPADLVLIKSSGEDGLAFIETANLDGESNLKRRQACLDTNDIASNQLDSLRAELSCKLPNTKLYEFEGAIHGEQFDKPVSLGVKEFLQRGATLRNTEWIYGLVVYSGVDTKLYKNLDIPSNKVSRLQRKLGRTVLAMFGIKLVLLIFSATYSGVFQTNNRAGHAYYGWSHLPGVDIGFIHLLSYFVLYTYLIPISLFVTVELVRLAQAVFMAWDDRMPGMRPRNSNANENLGMVQHIFSDKTGTFTANIMRFARLTTCGRSFNEEIRPGSCMTETSSGSRAREFVVDMLRAMAVCNTAVPDHEVEGSDGIVYQADSPDEIALLEASAKCGFELTWRKSDYVEVKEPDSSRLVKYPVLATLEFTPERKRMSVITELPDGTIRLYCKGADSHVMPRCASDDPMYNEIDSEVGKYAHDGFRTLVFARVDMSRDEFEDWKADFDDANAALANRQEQLDAVCERIEMNMEMIGATAVEDCLQDQVPETIAYFHRAGIQVWLLTGDKQETAITIGFASRLLRREFELVIINANDAQQCCSMVREHLEFFSGKKSSVDFALVINGTSLEWALDHCPNEFVQLGNLSRSVICCRSTPLQKARVVRLGKEILGLITLSVGDGSNDVSMIKEADVGVGIMGREGAQAARASDYAISEFKQLLPLICIHGRYSYLRLSGLIQYSFYKNVTYILPQFYYGFVSGFSAQVYYDEWLLSFFNIFFTSLPPLIYGFVEKDLREETILENPEVYRRMQKQPLYNRMTFAKWIGNSVYHSLVLFLSVYMFGAGSNAIFSNGQVGGMWTQAILASHVGVLTVLIRMGLFWHHWNLLTHFALVMSALAYFSWLMLENVWWSLQPDLYWVWFYSMKAASLFFFWLIVVTMCLLPNVVIEYMRRTYWPTDVDLLQERENYASRFPKTMAVEMGTNESSGYLGRDSLQPDQNTPPLGYYSDERNQRSTSSQSARDPNALRSFSEDSGDY